MKKLSVFLVMFSLSCIYSVNAQKFEKVWETTVKLKTPESVLFDEERNVMYVSNINGDPAQKAVRAL